MRHALLGRSGLRVSELCLGTLTFGERKDWGELAPPPAIFPHALIGSSYLRKLALGDPALLDAPARARC